MGSWSVPVEKSAVTLNVPHDILYWPKTYHILGSVEDIVRAAQPSSCQRGYLLIVTSVVAVSFSRRQTTHMSSYRAQSDTQCRQNLAHTHTHAYTRRVPQLTCIWMSLPGASGLGNQIRFNIKLKILWPSSPPPSLHSVAQAVWPIYLRLLRHIIELVFLSDADCVT